MRVHLDFETFCDFDIREVGLERYVTHSSFEVTLTALCLNDARVLQWRGMSRHLIRTLQAFAKIPDMTWHAYNAPFEIGCLKRYGIDVPLERWRCTMAHAYARGFAGRLRDVCEALDVGEDKAKLKDGDRLIARFCKPAPKNHKADRYGPGNDPEGWARFELYNRQDVVAEREIARKLAAWPMTEDELRAWRLDQRINRRGVPVDVVMAKAAAETATRWSERYNERVKELTAPSPRERGLGGRQVAALLEWCRANGYDRDNLQVKEIEAFLNEDPRTQDP